MPTSKLCRCDVSRRDMLRIGAGVGFGLFGNIGPVPRVFSRATSRGGRVRQILVVFGGSAATTV